MTSFADLGVAEDLARVLADRGATEPFPIQAATLPDAIGGRDVCGKAPTGSGKTLAFGVSTIMGVSRYGKAQKHRPTGLILVPTRELATQVCNELRPLTDEWNMRIAPVFGGTGFGKQLDAIQRGLDIMVATPGRLEDLISRGDVHLDNVRMLVLDEADRMADMGFLPAVKRLADQTHPERQTLLFSATLDGDVNVLIDRYQDNPVTHEVEVPEEERGEVVHHFWSVDKEDRLAVTARLTAKHWPAMVFVRTRHGADRLARQIKKQGVDAVAIHGNRSQAQRERALEAFSSGKAAVIVATDVAARGIHVDNVALVVHFDPPAIDKDYIHRSGRTGRAGADGIVVSMVLPDKLKDVKKLQRDLRFDRGADPVDESMLLDDDAFTLLHPVKDDRAGGGKGGQGKGGQGKGGQGRSKSGGKGQGKSKNKHRGGHNKAGRKPGTKPGSGGDQRGGGRRHDDDGGTDGERRHKSNARKTKSPDGRKPAKGAGPKRDGESGKDAQPGRKKKRKPKNRARPSQAGARRGSKANRSTSAKGGNSDGRAGGESRGGGRNGGANQGSRSGGRNTSAKASAGASSRNPGGRRNRSR